MTDPTTTDPPAGDPPAGDPPAGNPPADGDGDGDKEPKVVLGAEGGDEPTGSPEKYELQIGEGQEPDTEAMGLFEGVAREANLSNADAQRFVDLYGTLQTRAVRIFKEESLKEASRDPEIGGANFDRITAQCNRILQTHATEEFRAYLRDSGLGNHPELIRFIHKVGGSMREDTTAVGGHAASSDPAGDGGFLDKMYPTMRKTGSGG